MRLLLPRRFSTKTLDGWAKSVQKSGKNVFVKVDNGRSRGLIQLVANKQIAQEVKVGNAIRAIGSFEKSPGSQQETEFVADQLNIIGRDENPRYEDLSADNLRKKTHLRARNSQFASFLRARSALFRETHEFFMSRDFIHIDTPKLTRNDCEGGGEVFDVVTTSAESLNGSEGIKEDAMYLSVSSQLHLEAMVRYELINRLQRVYTLGPAFRAEKQQSHAHLSEFYMLEVEVAFVDVILFSLFSTIIILYFQNIEEMCSLVESYVQNMFSFLHSPKLRTELEIMNSQHLASIPLNSPFSRITYEDAVKVLTSDGSNVSAKSGLSKKNELDLVKFHDNQPVFVTHYPKNQKPFYMARTQDDTKTLSFDLLVPGVGELAGGSVREPDAEKLKERGCGIEWYLETRKRGQPPTAGFGIGFERLLQYLLGIQNIKDTLAFPRWHRHCQC
ncbi:CRE-NARS-2 protein [Caenorhabditis remanei]|uniref:CRE-NARS-2 protein n=1 Tax=Caenorhabditis remanei TaxID=31234 RepID=E3MIC4_CAERE|nr:CRE-NARS-2 protein [Caenorhabditis remanei]